MSKTVSKGDILLYTYHGLASDAVAFGEELEDGVQKKEYNHVAVALNGREKIEADGHAVNIHPIDFGSDFDVFTVSTDPDAINKALSGIQKYLGQGYDWLEIVDQGVRDASLGLFHLPKELIMETETHMKICSTLAQKYLEILGIPCEELASPEDVFLAIEAHLNGEEAPKNETSETPQQDPPQDPPQDPVTPENPVTTPETPQEPQTETPETPAQESKTETPTENPVESPADSAPTESPVVEAPTETPVVEATPAETPVEASTEAPAPVAEAPVVEAPVEASTKEAPKASTRAKK